MTLTSEQGLETTLRHYEARSIRPKCRIYDFFSHRLVWIARPATIDIISDKTR
jgi:hypothetical protein